MKFSVVTPSFNQGRWIRETLESVIRNVEQLKEGTVEHLVMDGGSSDETVGILEKWKEEKEGGRYRFAYRSERDRGQTHAINKGLAESGGEILSYLCSDDLLEDGTLAAVAEIFKAQPGIDVVYGDYFFLEGDSGWKRLKKAEPFDLERLRRHNFISQPATFWRRGVYERFGGFDENLRFCMDHEYWLRISGKVRWFYLERPLAVMRLHADAKTSASLGEAWEETLKMVSTYGLEKHFKQKARWMKSGGHWHYLAKRKVAAWWGRRRKG